MLTIKKYNDPKYISDIHDKLKKHYSFNEKKLESIEEVLSCKHIKANLFVTFVTCVLEQHKDTEKRTNRNLSSNDVDYSEFKDVFELEFLETILIDSNKYISMDTEDILQKMHPYLKLVDVIKCTPWQWYCENETDSLIIGEIYKTLTNLKTPFGDDRFRALPIHVNCYQKGNNRSEWLRDEIGAINTYYDREKEETYQVRDEECYYSIVLDAKIGIVLFFKDKPSITISFNFDENKNIYIHQIQSQAKDRGHYKIKGDWKEGCINYLKELFPDFKLHLISGEDISKLVADGYKSPQMPECMIVKDSTLSRIKHNYAQLIPKHHNWVNKCGIQYRELSL